MGSPWVPPAGTGKLLWWERHLECPALLAATPTQSTDKQKTIDGWIDILSNHQSWLNTCVIMSYSNFIWNLNYLYIFVVFKTNKKSRVCKELFYINKSFSLQIYIEKCSKVEGPIFQCLVQPMKDKISLEVFLQTKKLKKKTLTFRNLESWHFCHFFSKFIKITFLSIELNCSF